MNDEKKNNEDNNEDIELDIKQIIQKEQKKIYISRCNRFLLTLILAYLSFMEKVFFHVHEFLEIFYSFFI